MASLSPLEELQKLQEAQETVRHLLAVADPETITSGNGDEKFLDALTVLQSDSSKRVWVREAWIIWFNHAIHTWEQALESGLELGDSDECWEGFEKEPPANVSIQTLYNQLTTDRLGADCNRLMDRFLDILNSGWHATQDPGKPPNRYAIKMMHLIARRTGCSRKNDPQHDLRIFRYLVKEYELNPGLLAQVNVTFFAELAPALEDLYTY